VGTFTLPASLPISAAVPAADHDPFEVTEFPSLF